MKHFHVKSALSILLSLCFLLSLSSCGDGFSSTPRHEHTFREEWSYDEVVHWKQANCEHQDAISYNGFHEFNESYQCTVCSFQATESKKLEYKLNEDQASYELQGLDGERCSVVIIPKLHEGLPVTSIAQGAFASVSGFEVFVIPDSVTTIGKSVFSNLSGVTSIIVPDSVTSIGEAAFFDCSLLTELHIPSGLTKIDHRTYSNCSSIPSFILPEGVSYIGEGAFYNCTALKEINIPALVTKIDGSAFEGCESLATVYYGGTPEQWTEIEIWPGNEMLEAATVSYFSEAQPTEAGNYWHYVDGVPTSW